MVGLANATSVLGSPKGELSLRIRGSSRAGQIVSLASGKCTVGSAPGCTLRLRAHGVRPLHCLILRGEHGMVARSWSVDTRLNGRMFEDARLTPGDRLSFGPIEVEVVGQDGSSGDRGRTVPSPKFEAPSRGKRPTPQSRQRAKRLIAEIRKLRKRLSQLLAISSRSTQVDDSLRAQLAALEAERASQAAAHSQWVADRSDNLVDCDRREAELAALAQELESQRRELQTAELQFAQQQKATAEKATSRQAAHAADELSLRQELDRFQIAEADLAQREAVLVVSRAELDADRQRLDSENQLVLAQLEQRETQLAERETELASRLVEIEKQRQADEAQRRRALRQLEGRQSELDQLARELDDRGQAAERLDNLLNERRDELSRAQQQLEHDRREFTFVQDEIDRRRQEIQQLEKQLDGKSGEHQLGQSDLLASRAELDQARADQRSAAKKLAARQAEFDARLKEFDARQISLDDRQAVLEATQAELDQQRLELEIRETECRELTERLDLERAEVAEAQASLAAAREQFESVQQAGDGDLSEREAALLSRIAAFDQTEQSARHTQTTNKAIQAALDEQRAELDAARSLFEQEREAARLAWEQQSSELAERASQLDEQSQRAAKDQAAWQYQRDESQVAWQQQAAQLADRQATLEAAEQQIAQEREVLAAAQAELANHTANSSDGAAHVLASEQVELESRTAEIDNRAAELADRATELDQARASLEAEQRAWTQSRSAAEEQQAEQLERLSETAIEIAAQQENLRAERQAWEAERETWEAERQSFASRSEELRDALRRERAQLVADQEKLLEEHAAFTAEREAFLSQASSPPAGFSSHAVEAEPGSYNPNRYAGAEDHAAEMRHDDGSGEQSTESDEDVFARLRTLTLLKESTAEAEPPKPQEPPPRLQPVQEPQRRTGRTAPAAQPGADEEESIEAYMARLLNRMRGGPDEPAAARPAPAPVVETPVEEPLESDEEPTDVTPIEYVAPEAPLTIVPRGATAAACDMAAMRALANMSVHSALSAHRKNHRRRKAKGKWLLTAMAVALSAVVTYRAFDGTTLDWYAAAIGWIVSVFCVATAATASGQLLRDGNAAIPKTSDDEPKQG